MIENKLHTKLLSLNGLAARLSSLNRLAGLSYAGMDRSALSDNHLASFFDTATGDTSEKNKTESEKLPGLKGAILSFQGVVKSLSERLNGFFSKPILYKHQSESSSTSVSERYVQNKHEVEKSVTELRYMGIKLPGVRKDILREKQAADHSFIHNFIQTDSNRIIPGKEKNGQEQKILTQIHAVWNEKKSTLNTEKELSRLHEVTSMIRNSTVKKERPLEGDVVKRFRAAEKVAVEKSPVTIHQTFGDIIVQPASVDVSMQQLKVKIQDILKQARDSMY